MPFLPDFMHSLESSLLHDFLQGLLAVHLQGRVVLFRRHLRLAHRRESVRVSDPLAVLDGLDPVRFIFLERFNLIPVNSIIDVYNTSNYM